MIWTNANPNPGSWSTALAFCDTSSTSGFTDWRLPNVNELSSVRDYSASNYYSIPLSTLNGTYWTSTSDADVTARAWTVGFGLSNKTIEPITKTESHDIFCVR